MSNTIKTNNMVYLFLLTTLWVLSFNTMAAESVELFHVHGLSYSADGKTLYIPVHVGLALYQNGQWRKAPGPKHDYMGFSATRNAFYTSGHPAAGSREVNPFGLIKSTDQGRTWKKLGMTGEADFHVLATSYETNVVYLHSTGPNSRIPSAGLFYTANDGATWQHAQRQGAPKPFALAVHPTQPQQVAIGAEQGLFLSKDNGKTFEQVSKNAKVYGVWFDLNGKYLWYAGIKFSPFLIQLNLKTRQEQLVNLPSIGRDAVDYIAQNPVRLNEYAISTFKRSVFISSDAGESWQQIAKQGATQ